MKNWTTVIATGQSMLISTSLQKKKRSTAWPCSWRMSINFLVLFNSHNVSVMRVFWLHHAHKSFARCTFPYLHANLRLPRLLRPFQPFPFNFKEFINTCGWPLRQKFNSWKFYLWNTLPLKISAFCGILIDVYNVYGQNWTWIYCFTII